MTKKNYLELGRIITMQWPLKQFCGIFYLSGAILSVEMQTAVTSDEKVFRLNENEELIEETTLSEMEPERKTVEPVMDQPAEDSDIQTGLFDASNPPLNK